VDSCHAASAGVVAVVVHVVAEVPLCLEDQQRVVDPPAEHQRLGVVRRRLGAVAAQVVGEPAEAHQRPAAPAVVRCGVAQARRLGRHRRHDRGVPARWRTRG
jgi:hypothetical protein